jgi:GH18 family chitinase
VEFVDKNPYIRIKIFMKKKLLLIFFTSFICFSLTAQQFKVVGYLPYYRFDLADKIDFTKTTHLYFAFLNPDSLGNLSIPGSDPAPVVAIAKAANPDLTVWVSIGGGGMKEEWSLAYRKFLKAENRSAFVHSLTEYVLSNGYDGLDVDLEWDAVDDNYSPFVLELRDSLHARGKLITSALPAIHRYKELTQQALEAFDFINIMAYDKTGPWNPNHPGPHSDYQYAVDAIAFWKNEGVAGDRLTLGVPFYGYDFTDQSHVTAFTFGSIIAEDSLLAYKDQDGKRYYNGIPTIQKKTLYALEQVAGIMIWELGQDAFGSLQRYSLLSAIDYVVEHGELPIITALQDDLTAMDVKCYPNPFHDEIIIRSDKPSIRYRAQLVDVTGRTLIQEEGYLAG